MTLDFHPPDIARFPCLELAYQAAKSGGTVPAVLNAANEEAVHAYLDEQIGFLQIAEVLDETMARHSRQEASDLDTVLAADAWARQESRRLIAEPANRS